MADENTLMLFTDEQIEKFSSLFDDKFDFSEIISKKWLGAGVEAVDGKIAKWSFDWINNLASPYIPDSYKDEISTAIDDLLDGDNDYIEAANAVFDVIDEVLTNVKVNDIVDGLIAAALALLKTVVNIWLEAKAVE